MSLAALYCFGRPPAALTQRYERSDEATRSSALIAALLVAIPLDKINFCPS
jgi:hypothetical protein